jgi:DNA recombination protein RmuC
MINHSGWQVQGVSIDPILVLLGIAAAGLLGLIALVVLIWRNGVERARASAAQEAAQQMVARAFETEVAELKGRLQTMAELSVTRQSELSRTINERLDRIGHNLGTNIDETTRKTTENLTKLHERLAVIDNAQRNITELSTRVVSLQDILANKQQRGAFGQLRMETIIQDGLPSGAFTFQATLSNGKRPDCLIHLPSASAGIVIDAKFPLEGFEVLRSLHEEMLRRDALKRIRIDVGKHIDDMAAKYVLPGETQDTMLMFVPSESIYAELHENFPELLQKAHRARVVIVSPNMLMLAVQTMQAIMKDVQMREQAGVIQSEVGTLMQDVNRLRERVGDLQRHFGLANTDLEKILTSADKIASRGRKIETLDLENNTPAAPAIPSGANGNGRLAS